MKSELLESIKNLEDAKRKEQLIIIEKYNNDILALKYKCNHIDDEGNSVLIRAGHPFHSGWDRCQICDRYIETNVYGRG